MSDHVPFVDALRAELLLAAARRPRQRRPVGRSGRRVGVLAGALATLAAVLLGLAFTVTRPTTAQADVHVVVDGGRITVTLVDLEQDPARIEAAAREAGLDVRVTALPVGPSLVGRFVRSASLGPLPAELRKVGADGDTFAGFSLPAGWAGRLDLAVGRPAAPAEAYLAHTDAFGPGEALACSGLRGATASEAAAVSRARELVVSFDVDEPSRAGRVRSDELHERELDDWVVAAAHAVSAERVVIVLTPPGSAVPASDPC